MNILPVDRGEALSGNPQVFVLYAPPKCGKTTLINTLPNNLIMDLEEGTKYLKSLSVSIVGYTPPTNESEASKKSRHEAKKFYISEVGKSIVSEGYPYDFLTIDTVTELEEMLKPLALEKYKATPMGGSFSGTDVLTLPRGAGHYYYRLAYKEALNKLSKLASNIILIGHVKDTFVSKEGKEVQAKDLDLTGKLKQITCAGADAIGYLHRGEDGELLINFKSSDEVLCGSRCPQLRGKEIKIADFNSEENKLENIRWDIVYPDSFKQPLNDVI